MKIDDPKIPEFASWRSYINFANSVRLNRRFIWKPEVTAFLETVLATAQNRDRIIKQGSILYRAQLGIEYHEEGYRIDLVAFGPERMKPKNTSAIEGRTNPTGIPMLYLATSEETAISEVRPWVGSELSVAQFKILRELKLMDLSVRHGESSIRHLSFSSNILDGKPVSRKKKEKAVWCDVDNAFSRPVTRSDESADYVPTQILSELFCENGYDGIVYRSQFGESGFNIVLFNLQDAEAINAAPYEVKGIKLDFKEIGNRWFSRNHQGKKPSL